VYRSVPGFVSVLSEYLSFLAKTMRQIATDLDLDFRSLLDGLEHPAILLTPDYQIVASNQRYQQSFGDVPVGDHCFRVSHGYDKPCDQAGESCPLQACTHSGERERVLHIHNTPRGREHIDVEMLPIKGRNGELRYFIEMLKPVRSASAEISSDHMVGRSAAFNTMLELINLVAPHDTSVLLLGESGAGKELAAQAIHSTGGRCDKAMVTVECAGLTDTLFESELFGHVKGAFTGAVSNKPGLLESARGGTLFLDEIGDVPLGMQVKLLRLLETGSYRAVGSTQPQLADFRLICATNKDLPAMIAGGQFREDLYYRINTFPIHLPPLRERRADLALISRSILKKLSPNGGYRLTDSAVKRLQDYDFPGNIRELKNILERATIFAHSSIIDLAVLERCFGQEGRQAEPAPSPVAPHKGPWLDLKAQEQQYLKSLLQHCNGDKEKAADIAGISLRSLYRRLEE
tara:strand:+ start:4310 stop:5692 length:1383 start_codon:yes stop_codon:yes gene_type:complete